MDYTVTIESYECPKFGELLAAKILIEDRRSDTFAKFILNKEQHTNFSSKIYSTKPKEVLSQIVEESVEEMMPEE